MEKLEFNGKWWLPENPSNSLSGKFLFLGDDDPRLELVGSFQQDLKKLFEHFDAPIILGMSTTGKPITLHKCLEVRKNLSAGGPPESVFEDRAALIGHHFSTPKEILFQSMAVRYDQLSNWAWLSGFKSCLEQERDGKFKKYSVEYSFPNTLEVNIQGIKIRLVPAFQRSGNGIEHENLRQKIFIEAQPLDPIPLEKFLDNIFYHIQNFISLGIGRAVYPIEVTAKIFSPQKEAEEQKDFRQNIEVYYAINRSSIMDKAIHPARMLFSFPTIRERFQEYLNNWFRKAGILKPVYDLYFSTIYGSEMYLESRFLSLTQALETYHRRAFPGVPLDVNQFIPILGSFKKTLNEFEITCDTRDGFTGKLEYLNEFSLRQRIKSILALLEGSIEFLIPNKERFVSQVVDTRNYLTHYDPKLESRALDGQNLYGLTEQIKFLLEICFLKEIGFSKELQEKIIKENQNYINLRRMVDSIGQSVQ